MKQIIFLSVLILLTSTIFAQKDIIAENHKQQMQKVLAANEVTFYGLDFSKAVLSQPDKINYNVRYRKYFVAWISRYEEIVRPETKFSRWIDKEVIYEPGEVQSLCKKERTWIRFDDYDFPIDTLQQIIQNYELSQSNGVGMVVNVVNMNKRREQLIAWFTFFDIQTREILWATKIRGRANGTGMTAHWGEGMINATKRYVDKVYKKEYK